MNASAIVIIVILALVFLAVTVIWGWRAHQRRVTAGREDLVGRIAEARTPLNPKGTVFVEGENWTALSDSGRIEAGEEVLITKVEGLKLRVTNIKKEVE